MLRKRVAVASVGLALVLGACSKSANNSSTGSTADSAQLVSLVQSSRSKAVAQKTANYSETVVVTPQKGSTNTVTVAGQMDLVSRRFSMSFNLPGMGNLSELLDKTTMYMQIPGLSSMMGGKPWFKIDLASLPNEGSESPFGPMVASMKQLVQASESQDPTQQLSLLAGASGSVTTVGSETVSGTATTHYRFTVDVNKAISNLPADAQDAMKPFLSQIGLTNFPADVWIDRQGLVRRLHLLMNFKPSATPSPAVSGIPASALPKTADITVNFSDYGSPVDVTVPPPDQVIDFSVLAKQLSSPSP